MAKKHKRPMRHRRSSGLGSPPEEHRARRALYNEAYRDLAKEAKVLALGGSCNLAMRALLRASAVSAAADSELIGSNPAPKKVPGFKKFASLQKYVLKRCKCVEREAPKKGK